MFSTIEEAEKAQAMLRRFAGFHAEAVPAGDGERFGSLVLVRDLGPVRSWEEVADLLCNAGAPQEDDRRAGLLAQARAHLGVVKKRIGGVNDSIDGGLIATLDCILEALT